MDLTLLLQRDGLITETYLAFPAAVKLRHGVVVVRYLVVDTEGTSYSQKLRRKYLVNAANPNPQLGNQGEEYMHLFLDHGYLYTLEVFLPRLLAFLICHVIPLSSRRPLCSNSFVTVELLL